MLLSALLHREVLNESGWSFGRVFDVRVRVSGEDARLMGLVVGPAALRERVMGASVLHERPYVPWEAVVRVGPRVIVVRDDTRLEESETTGPQGPGGGGER